MRILLAAMLCFALGIACQASSHTFSAKIVMSAIAEKQQASLAAQGGVVRPLHHFLPHLIEPAQVRIELRHLYRLADETIEQRIATRMARQEILTCWPSPTVTAVIDESVLRRRIGGQEVLFPALIPSADK